MTALCRAKLKGSQAIPLNISQFLNDQSKLLKDDHPTLEIKLISEDDLILKLDPAELLNAILNILKNPTTIL